jgi:hypothetical protein
MAFFAVEEKLLQKDFFFRKVQQNLKVISDASGRFRQYDVQ